jgi:hypothetical protein
MCIQAERDFSQVGNTRIEMVEGIAKDGSLKYQYTMRKVPEKGLVWYLINRTVEYLKMSKKRFACLVAVITFSLSVSFPLIANRAFAYNVPLTIQETQGVSRVHHPITVGVPFPAGALSSLKHVRVLNSSKVEIPAQAQVLATWDKPGSSVKWVLFDFHADVRASGNVTYYVEYGPGVTRQSSPSFLRVNQTSDKIMVDTGAFKFSVRKDKFTLIDDATLNGLPLIKPDTSQGLYLVDQDGIVYKSSNAPGDYRVTIEDSGPLRAQIKCSGWYVSDAGDKRFQYIVRFNAYAGQSIIKVYHTFIFTEDMFKYRIKNIAVKTTLHLGDTLTYAVGGEKGIFSKGLIGDVSLLHDDWNHYCIRNNAGGVFSEGSKSKGWLDLSDGSRGVTVFLREMWQNYPLELEANGKTLFVHLWPAHGNYSAQVKAKKQRALKGGIGHFWPFHEGSDLNLVAVSPASHRHDRANPETFFDHDYINNAAGISKTYEMVYYFHEGDHLSGNSENTAKAYSEELMAINSEWICKTEVFGRIHAYDPVRFARAEEVLEKAFDAMLRAQEAHLDYGMINYGDGHYSYTASGYGNRYWLDYRVNWQMAPWILYVRKGDPKYLRFAIATNRHIMDVDTCQITLDFVDKKGNHVIKEAGGGQRTHEVGAAHWHKETRREVDMDANPEPFLAYYYLTGYKRAREIAELRGEQTLRHKDDFSNGPSARGATGALGVPIQLYQLTWDHKYLASANTMFDAILNRLVRPDGYWGRSSSNWDIMTTTWPLEPFEEFCRMTERQDAKKEYLRVAKAEGGMGLTSNTSGFRTHGYPLRAYAYAYELTGDREFISYGKHYYDLYIANAESEIGLDSNRPDMHGLARIILRLPYFLETLAQYGAAAEEPLYPPAFIRLPQNKKVTFFTHKEADHGTHIAFTFRTGTAFFNDWQDSGNFTLRILDPDNKEVLRERFIIPKAYNDIFAGGRDNRLKSFAIPRQGKAGPYRIEISADKAGHVFSLASNDSGKTVIYVPSEGILLDRGRYYFWVSSEAKEFSLKSAGWRKFVLFDPDGKVYAKPTWSYKIHPTRSQRGKLWSIGMGGDWAGSVTIYIESGALPYFSLSKATYFLLPKSLLSNSAQRPLTHFSHLNH